MAPANQLRLSFAGSEDGEAETETCRAAKPLWRTTTRTSRPFRAQLAEPPYADPHVRWCGRGGRATVPPMPIGEGRVLFEREREIEDLVAYGDAQGKFTGFGVANVPQFA